MLNATRELLQEVPKFRKGLVLVPVLTRARGADHEPVLPAASPSLEADSGLPSRKAPTGIQDANHRRYVPVMHLPTTAAPGPDHAENTLFRFDRDCHCSLAQYSGTVTGAKSLGPS